ncbi:SCO family protein [Sphingomonas sp.]|uniref:SCO family protein n=1 Tax=Sphingomonas sp. TaxID=28214 RepID=UPI003CC69D6B
MNRLSAALLLAVVAPACTPAAPPTAPLAGARIGGPFSLTDQDGRPFTDRDLGRRYAIVYFGYTFCPDACPTDMGALAAGLKQVERSDPATAAKVRLVFVTVDPARDTPPVLKTFVRAFHPQAIGLTGSQAAIDATARAYGVAHGIGPKSPGGGYLVDHSRAAYLMGPDGRPIALAGQDGGPAAVAATIRQWVK